MMVSNVGLNFLVENVLFASLLTVGVGAGVVWAFVGVYSASGSLKISAWAVVTASSSPKTSSRIGVVGMTGDEALSHEEHWDSRRDLELDRIGVLVLDEADGVRWR